MDLNKGFTIIEVLLVVVIVSVIATMAIPNYVKSIHKSHERDAVIQLTAIHAANKVYEANANTYMPTGGGDLAAINSGLKINVLANGKTFEYTSSAADAYSATAARGTDFTILIDQNALSANNPCCDSGTCYTLPDC